MRRLSMILPVFALIAIPWQQPRAQDAAPKPAEFKNGVVVSVSAPASEVGLEILKIGGNAVDAAVATAFALAVTHPAAGNIGGGGFMLVHPPKGEPTVFDYRETAPAAATKDMFKPGDSNFGHRVVGVPGTVGGMALAHERFGTLPWKTLLLPAVKLAEDGFVLDAHHARSLNKELALARDFAEFQRVFGRTDKKPWAAGDRLVQPDLAKTLRLIAEKGPATFYAGTIAEQIVAEMKAGGGLITGEDLTGYKAVERKPVHGVYRGYDVYAPPPPSSGGICLVEMLNMLETFDLKKHDRQAPETLHLLAESMRRAFCDRARHLGDPTFTKIPEHLTSKVYAKKLASEISLAKATQSDDLAKDIPLAAEGDSTTHYSVIDKGGLAVSNTYTLEHSYGSRVVVKGAGFLLNNEMLDFNRRPGFTDRKGAIGTEPNSIAPGKRMLSSQCPTIVAKDGKAILVTGSPGSRTIINTVLEIIINVIDYNMPIQEAVDLSRMHHAWFPDGIQLEKLGTLAKTADALRAMGHRVAGVKTQGDGHSIWVNPKTGTFVGAADKRLSGKVAGY
ncbi:MAG: gamma-glutamyltransferase [Planctomycetes bacterium]|nr:gamma-glutamyltransferase [Planctomycetota bacterium]